MDKLNLINFEKYIITKDGKIFSKYYNKYLNGNLCCNGYYYVRLKCIDIKCRLFLLHRVIWFYFNGDILEGMQVNHIDEDKTNNALSNLNLMTPKENNNWCTHNKRMAASISKALKGRKHSAEHNLKVALAQQNDPNKSKPLIQINLTTGEIIKEWLSVNDVSRNTNYSQGSISNCCNGGFFSKTRNKWVNVKQAYGYGWKYV